MVRRFIPCLMLLLLLAVPAQATVFFSSGFEEVPLENGGWGYASGWCFFNQPTRTTPCPEMDQSTDYAYSGVRSLKQHYDADWSDPNPQTHGQEIAPVPHLGTLASAGGDLWVTYRYRTVAFTYTAWTSTKHVYYKNYQNTAPTFVSNFFFGARSPGFSVQGLASLCPTNPSSGPFQSCNLYPNMANIPLNDNQWYCLEEHIRLNNVGSANGSVEIFTNGVQTLGYYNLKWLADVPSPSNATPPGGACCYGWNLPTTIIDKVALFKQNGDGDRYWDDFVVSDTRIGCSGTIDSTPPEVPSAPTITSGDDLPVVLTWPSVANSAGDLAGYVVLRKLNEACSGGAALTPVFTTGLTNTWTDTTVPQGTTHVCYRIRSRDTTGNQSASSSGVDQDIVTASANAFALTWVTDTLGGNVTFNGQAYKLRYWTGANNGAKTEITGLGGVTSYRLNKPWSSVDGGFACVEAAGSGGVYETSINPNSYLCNSAPVVVTLAQLRIHATNPRWLADVNGRAIMLAGSGFNGCCTPYNLSRSAIQDSFQHPEYSEVVADNFNRANANPIGGVYDYYGDTSPMQLVGNQVRITNAASVANMAVDQTTTLSSDQYAAIDLVSFAASPDAGFGLGVRMQPDGPTRKGYQCTQASNNNIEIAIYNASGTYSALKTIAWADAPGRYQCEVYGTVIRFLFNGTVILAYDTKDDAVKYSSGKAGFRAISFGGTTGDIVLDNYSAGNVITANDFSAQLAQQVTNGSKIARWMLNERTHWDGGSGATAFALQQHSKIPLNQMPYCLTGTRTDTSTGTSMVVGVYDLTCFNQSFFDRLRTRAIAAATSGIVPVINLFTGWQMSQSVFESFSNPMGKSNNNIQGIGMDTNSNGKTEEAHTLVNATVTTIQRNYIAKVVSSVCDVGPVLFEVSNEDMGASGSEFAGIKAWQNMVVEQIKITNTDLNCVNSLVVRSMYGPPFGYHANNAYLFSDTDTVGDIIAPGPAIPAGDDYVNDPPANDGATKVVFVDMDHQGVSTPLDWEWKVFLRAGYPIYLDEHWFDNSVAREAHRIRLKGVNEWGAKLKDLGAMEPVTDTGEVSSGFMLANACQEYLAYRPSEGTLSIDLSACSGDTFVVEAFNPATNTTYSAGTVSGGGTENFNPTEWSGDFVIYLLNDADVDVTPPAKVQGVTIR